MISKFWGARAPKMYGRTTYEHYEYASRENNNSRFACASCLNVFVLFVLQLEQETFNYKFPQFDDIKEFYTTYISYTVLDFQGKLWAETHH